MEHFAYCPKLKQLRLNGPEIASWATGFGHIVLDFNENRGKRTVNQAPRLKGCRAGPVSSPKPEDNLTSVTSGRGRTG
ncbi:hypothetical protein [Pseudokordiimonas caeni]|uniref:hypothetical protein n=1 Tax=Pseudokordiimonas caeni TaxID=2997908 RepID=UPI0028116117|nr:hypothetical protein [Pseudokordiimonas caeni]